MTNFTDLYNYTIDHFNEISKDDALRIIRELVYQLEGDRIDLDDAMYEIRDILDMNEEADW